MLLTLFTWWQGSSTGLLNYIRPDSEVKDSLRCEFMTARRACQKLCCVAEALPETFMSIPLFTVSDCRLLILREALLTPFPFGRW